VASGSHSLKNLEVICTPSKDSLAIQAPGHILAVVFFQFGLGKLMEESQGPHPVHATDIGNGFAMVLYSDDSVRTRSMRDPEVQRLLENEPLDGER